MKLSEQIVVQLEQNILQGVYRAGEKLPPEREFAQQLKISRNCLREVLQTLQAKGLVVRKQGGGTFIQPQLIQAFSDPLFALIARSHESQYDLLEFRHALEGISAYYAALRATPADQQHIQQCLNKIDIHQASIEQLTQQLLLFSFTIAKAAHNSILLHLHHSMQGLLSQSIEQNLLVIEQQPSMKQQILTFREQLVVAINQQQPQQAQQLCQQHFADLEQWLQQRSTQPSQWPRSIQS